MIPIGFFLDEGLTTEATSLALSVPDAGGTRDRVVYLGSQASRVTYQVESDPGNANIVVSIVDAAAGSGVQASHIRLALDAEGLDTATPGVPLDLDTTVIVPGAIFAMQVHMRISTPPMAPGVYTDLTLRTNSLVEVPD